MAPHLPSPAASSATSVADLPPAILLMGPTASGKTGLALVLSRPYIVGTVMLWLAYFSGLVIVYGLVNWMPVLFKDAGIAPARAAVTAACSSSTAWAPYSSGC